MLSRSYSLKLIPGRFKATSFCPRSVGLVLIQQRHFSEPKKTSAWSINFIPPVAVKGIAIGGGFWVLTSVLYNLAYAFLELTPAASLYYGFIGGSLSTGLAAGALLSYNNGLNIVQYDVFKTIMANINQNEEISLLIGTNYTPSDIRGVSSQQGGFGIAHRNVKWFKPTMKMLFTLSYNVGNRPGKAIVTASVSRSLLSTSIEYIAIEAETKRIIVVGDQSCFVLHDELKSKISIY